MAANGRDLSFSAQVISTRRPNLLAAISAGKRITSSPSTANDDSAPMGTDSPTWIIASGNRRLRPRFKAS
jgi:hypothetical protein